MNIFSKIKIGFTKTRENLSNKIGAVINSFTKINEELFEELEEILISADIGFETSKKLCDLLRIEIKRQGFTDPKDIKIALKKIISEYFDGNNSLSLNTKPSIILVIGVNGAGKTTSIGKISNMLRNKGKSVLIAAGDTFRAAANEQLEVWAKRADCSFIKHQEGSDPAAVIFDAIISTKAKNIDVLICDTAGRLHNKSNLMGELKKINKIIDRELPDASKENLLVLDATTGQNGVNQVQEFQKTMNITGIILTKLDGTAKGGVILSIHDKIGVPVKFVGVGEGINDLQVFEPKNFAEALIGE